MLVLFLAEVTDMPEVISCAHSDREGYLPVQGSGTCKILILMVPTKLVS